jgi:hypothetical protein
MDNIKWSKYPFGNATDAYIDLAYDVNEEGDYWMHASPKWDGCIHLYQASNVPFSEEFGTPISNKQRDEVSCDDYIHICDLDDYIKKLLKLRKFCKNYFKNQEAWNKK